MNTTSESGIVLNSGDIFASRFKVRKPMGSGSLTDAYLCMDSMQSDKDVVLKIVQRRHYRRAGFINAFTMFTKSMISMDDPRHCRVHHVGRHKGDLYFIEDYIPEVTLRFWLIKTLTFEKRIFEGLKYLKQIVLAMDVLHKRGLYASTKPENIFLRTDDVILSDYWVAAFIPPKDFETNPPARQYLSYLAPEVKEDWSNLSPASDFFCAGAILYEILTGKPPLTDYLKPSMCSEIYTGEIDEIIEKSLDPSPVHRFQSPGELMSALNKIINIFAPGSIAVEDDDSQNLDNENQENWDMDAPDNDHSEDTIAYNVDNDSAAEPEEDDTAEVDKTDFDYPADFGIDDAGIRAPFDEDPQEITELNEMSWNEGSVVSEPEPEPETIETSADFPEKQDDMPDEELDVSDEENIHPGIDEDQEDEQEQSVPEESKKTQVLRINPDEIPAPPEQDGNQEKFKTSGEETVMMVVDGKEAEGPGFKKLEITNSDFLDSSPDESESNEEDEALEETSLIKSTADSPNKSAEMDTSIQPLYDGSVLPEVEEELDSPEDIFRPDDRAVQEIIPDDRIDAADKVSKMRSRHTGHIPILHAKDAWDDIDKNVPMVLWIKILLIVSGIIISFGGIFLGIFYDQIIRFFG